MVLIKSTMVPGTTEKLKQEYKNLIFVTNPEFLTERTAYQDLCNSKIHVLGLENTDKYNNPIKNVLESLHNSLWPESECVFVSNTQAEMIKYLTNSFYAYKVTFANHIYQLCQSMGVDYDGFIQAAIKSDPRLGELHWNVPGPDGSLGFGGKCFPKDFNGMIKLMEQNGVDSDILKKVWEYNLNIREEQDWNKIEGATCQRQDQ